MPVIPPGDTVDRRPEVLPPSLLGCFDDAFVRSWDLYEAYVAALAARVAGELGLDRLAAGGFSTVPALAAQAGLEPARARTALDWLLRALAASGGAEVEQRGDEVGFRIRELESRDPVALREEQARHDPAADPAYELAAVAAAAWPGFLRGEIDGEQVLLAPTRLARWGEYFSNHNPLYAINNLVGAEACLEHAPQGPLRILELGGGLGSAADALLGRLAAAERLADVASYRLTDVAPPFLRRGLRTLQARWGEDVPWSAARLDIDQPFGEQGIEPGSVELVWAVNTVHVAHDLGASLAEIRRALAPGGVLVLGECVRPFPRQPLPPELIFLLLESFREPQLDPEHRPTGGFLTPEQWTAALRRAGLAAARLTPDIAVVRRHYPSFVVAAVTASRAE